MDVHVYEETYAFSARLKLLTALLKPLTARIRTLTALYIGKYYPTQGTKLPNIQVRITALIRTVDNSNRTVKTFYRTITTVIRMYAQTHIQYYKIERNTYWLLHNDSGHRRLKPGQPIPEAYHVSPCFPCNLLHGQQ